jgi:hypothetical protein
MATSWNGTPVEYVDLTRALNRHCTCEVAPNGTLIASCEAHRMVTDDQRALNGLVFGRRIAARLQREEWLTRAPGHFRQTPEPSLAGAA